MASQVKEAEERMVAWRKAAAQSVEDVTSLRAQAKESELRLIEEIAYLKEQLQASQGAAADHISEQFAESSSKLEAEIAAL